MKTRKNEVQTLTPEQQGRGFFAIVATGAEMFDGEAQNMRRCYVRLRSGDVVNIATLANIDPDDPQPNGDYAISLNANHSQDVRDKGGEGWLFIGGDGKLHMFGVFSTNTTANELLPLAKDNMLKFSTEGFSENYDDGFLIYAVAPVLEGNDPGTQIAQNSLERNDNMAEATISKETVRAAALEKLNAADETDDKGADVATKIATTLADLGVKTSDPMYLDIFSDLLGVLTGAATAETEPTDSEGDLTAGMSDVESTNTAFGAIKGYKVAGVNHMKSSEYALPLATQSAPHDAADETVATNGALKGKKAMNKFVEILKANIGNPTSAGAAWSNYLRENGNITFDPDAVAVLPEILVQEINTVLTTRGEIWDKIYKTGLIYFAPAVDYPLESAKARGRGANSAKTSQQLAPTPRLIQPSLFYKFISLAADTVYKNGGLNGGIVSFVTRELAMKTLELLERAIVFGGVSDDQGVSISNFVYPIIADTVANGVYGDVYTMSAGESLPEAITGAAAQVLSGGELTLITTRENAMKLPYLTVGASNIPMFLNSAERGQVNIPGIDHVVYPTWITQSDLGAGNFGIVVDLSAYAGVGESTVNDSFYDFYMRTNEHDFEAMINFGGGLYKSKAASLVAAAAESATED